MLFHQGVTMPWKSYFVIWGCRSSDIVCTYGKIPTVHMTEAAVDVCRARPLERCISVCALRHRIISRTHMLRKIRLLDTSTAFPLLRVSNSGAEQQGPKWHREYFSAFSLQFRVNYHSRLCNNNTQTNICSFIYLFVLVKSWIILVIVLETKQGAILMYSCCITSIKPFASVS